jgi:AbrB family looped-hinge helix DNA binding protein
VWAVANVEASRIGKRGTVVIPARLRKRFGLDDGAFVIAEERPEGILLRPATLLPVELYDAERKAELLLGNATTPAEYKAAAEVRAMGLDPKRIPHFKPKGA